jgi:hypothetical protein
MRKRVPNLIISIEIIVLGLLLSTELTLAKTATVSHGTGAAMCGKHGGLKPTSSGATYCDYSVAGKNYDITCSGKSCSVVIFARPQKGPVGGKLPPRAAHPISVGSGKPVRHPIQVGTKNPPSAATLRSGVNQSGGHHR